MNRPYKTLHDIRARVTARWKHPRCKFQRGDTAQVNQHVLPTRYKGRVRPHYTSGAQQRRVGRTGEVIAVSCLPDGRIRSNTYRNGQATRMFTRYYVRFSDGIIQGFDSHHLDRVDSCTCA